MNVPAVKRNSLAEKMKKAEENPTTTRKTNKPQAERKRRERINKCLGQLKGLVLKATGKDEKKYRRLEKADILEMAVNHLYAMDKDVNQGMSEADDIFKEGYSRCVGEVIRCLRVEQGIDAVTKTNLINHLTVSFSHTPTDHRHICYDNQAFELSSQSESPSSPSQQMYPSSNPSNEGVQEVPPSVQSKFAKVNFQDQNMYMDFYNAPMDIRAPEVHSTLTNRLPCEFQPPPSTFQSQIGVPLHTSTPVAKKRHSVIPSFPALEDVTFSDCVTTSSSSDSGSSIDPWRPW